MLMILIKADMKENWVVYIDEIKTHVVRNVV